MTAPVDPKLATAASAQHELTQRKLEMDALRKRLRTDPSKEQKLREACEGFESIFVQKMWEQMRATLPKEGYLHSKEEEFWQSMFDQELAKKMTSAGGIGLADMIYEQLSTKLTDASRTTAPSSVREPVPVKPVSLVPRMITTASEGASGANGINGVGGKTGVTSSIYEPASPEAPVASDAQAPGAVGTDAKSVSANQAEPANQAGQAIVQQHLAELERQVAAASPADAASSAASGVAAAAAGITPPDTVAATGVVATQPGTVPAAAAEAGQAAAVTRAQRRAARDKDGAMHGLPSASVADGNTRKVRSPMRDAQMGPPIVHRTGAMKRVASPAATRTLAVPTGA
ncbi:rod-binding protein, partial [Nitratidesulfovibrio liaohensis]|uniref:rod-binding protein n=1 Tax=Nitratidesulfovibrio liaohensis TaxID=2604158 RepID=UPI001AAEA117